MAETPPLPPASTFPDSELLPYWCYHCEKRVSIETLANLSDLICHECKNGFVEAIAAEAAAATPPTSSPLPSTTLIEEPSFSHQFLQVLRLIAQTTRDDEAPTPPRPDPVSEAPSDVDDFLQIEFDGWENDVDEEDDVEFVNDDGDVSEDEIGEDEEEDVEDRRRRRLDILRLRIRDLASRATRERSRLVDWSEILMGLEDNTIELRVQMPESDRYIGNPEDYVDAVGFEDLLQNLAERDGEGRRGAPPAAKIAVEALQKVEITPEEEGLVCAICKDSIPIGEIARKLPCGHGYHGECIVPWLGSRNTCPVCRFELPTDDLEYEEERRKRSTSSAITSTSGTLNHGGNNANSG